MDNRMKYILWNAPASSIPPHCVFLNVSSNCLNQRMHNCTDCICLTFLQCAFSNVSSKGLPERMHLITLIPQSAGIRGCKITLVAFVWFFLHCAPSNVSSNRLPERMHTHTGLFDFSPLCVFKCLLKLPAWTDAKSRCLQFFNFSPLCIFKCVLNGPWEDAWSHRLHLFDFSLCTLATLSLKFFCMELSWSRFCSIVTRRKGLTPAAVNFKLRNYKCERKLKSIYWCKQ